MDKNGPRHKRWSAVIKYEGKDKFLGYFGTEKEAALAYDEEVSIHSR